MIQHKSKEKKAQKAYNRKRYLKYREQVLKKKKEYHQKNRETLLEKSRHYYKENLEKFRNYVRKSKPLVILVAKNEDILKIVIAKGKSMNSSILNQPHTKRKIRQEIDRLLDNMEYKPKISDDYLNSLLTELY